PKSITINGKNILGFHKDIKAYSYLLKSNSKIPLVKAAAMGNNISVEIEQAKGIPGTTIVKLIDNFTLETNTYYLNFDMPSVSDDFDNAIGNQWTWLRENKATHSTS